MLEAAAARFDIAARVRALRLRQRRLLAAHGTMLPDDWFETLRGFDAIYFGAVGWPDVVPDHVTLWGSLHPVPPRVRPVRQPAARAG